MLKNPTFWSLVVALLVVVAGSLFVPVVTGSSVDWGDLWSVLPVGTLVYIVSHISLSRFFGLKPTVTEKYIGGNLGIIVTAGIFVLGLIVFLLAFLS